MSNKLTLFIFCILLIVPSGSEVMAAGAGRGIGTDQSCHNFSHEDWLPVVKICRTCHVPHARRRGRAKANPYSGGLKWSKAIESYTYSLYNSLWSSSLTGMYDETWTAPFIHKKSGLPDGLSKLCLSCHNGVIAPDVFTLHHFVSLEFDVTRTELNDPDTTQMGISGPISEVLHYGKIQCPSCHDPHDEESVAGTKLLRVGKMDLCRVCHNR